MDPATIIVEIRTQKPSQGHKLISKDLFMYLFEKNNGRDRERKGAGREKERETDLTTDLLPKVVSSQS